MKYSYYPGCTLKTKAKELDRYALASAKALGLDVEEIPEWQCCGAVYPQARDETATKLSAVRTLASAAAEGRKLLTLCSACHNVIKRVNEDMKTDPTICNKANTYLGLEPRYTGETQVIHYLEMLRDDIGWKALSDKVVNPLKGVKIGAYYGCLLLRPAKVMAMDDSENPTIIEDFIRAIGATPVVYPQRNECCGAYVTFEDKSLAESRCRKIIDSALDRGADMLVTACPLCMYNLQQNGKQRIGVKYFTELLADALGVKEE